MDNKKERYLFFFSEHEMGTLLLGILMTLGAREGKMGNGSCGGPTKKEKQKQVTPPRIWKTKIIS